MPSRWIEFIREFALKNNTSYGCALSRPEVVTEYHKKYNTAKYQKMRKAGLMSESLEEALPSESQVKAPINLQVKRKKKKPSDSVREAFKMSSEDILSRRTINAQELMEITPVKKQRTGDFVKSKSITYDGEPVFKTIKSDKFGNRWLFGAIDNYFGFITPKGKVYRFKDGKYPSNKQEDFYEDILAMSITQNLIGDKNNYLKLI